MYFQDGFDPYGQSQYPGDPGVYVDRKSGIAHDFYGTSDEIDSPGPLRPVQLPGPLGVGRQRVVAPHLARLRPLAAPTRRHWHLDLARPPLHTQEATPSVEPDISHLRGVVHLASGDSRVRVAGPRQPGELVVTGSSTPSAVRYFGASRRRLF